MSDGSRTVPQIRLERYRLGELSESERQVLDERLRLDQHLRQRLAALDSSDQQILAASPPAEFAAAVRARSLRDEHASGRTPISGSRAWRQTSPWTLVPIGALCVAAAAASVVTLDPAAAPTAVTTASGDRIKGGSPSLLLFRKQMTQVETLSPGAVAHANDLVQVGYRASGHRFGVILSLDGRGIVTRHLPQSGDQAAPLQPGGSTLLHSAYRLDDAPRVERFYLVAADSPFAVSAVLAAVDPSRVDPLTSSRLPLDERAFVQASFLLRKE